MPGIPQHRPSNGQNWQNSSGLGVADVHSGSIMSVWVWEQGKKQKLMCVKYAVCRYVYVLCSLWHFDKILYVIWCILRYMCNICCAFYIMIMWYVYLLSGMSRLWRVELWYLSLYVTHRFSNPGSVKFLKKFSLFSDICMMRPNQTL